MEARGIGKRAGLAFAAAAAAFVAGYAVFIVLGLFFPSHSPSDLYVETIDKAFGTAAGLALMVYLTLRWSGKRITLIATAAVIIWIILQIVISGTFMWSSL
jgi:hypothetical protein